MDFFRDFFGNAFNKGGCFLLGSTYAKLLKNRLSIKIKRKIAAIVKRIETYISWQKDVQSGDVSILQDLILDGPLIRTYSFGTFSFQQAVFCFW